MQTLFKMYRALEQEVRRKEREEVASAAKIEELAQAMFRKEADLHRAIEDNRKLKEAAEEATLNLSEAQEQVEQLAAHVRLDGSLDRTQSVSALKDANELLKTLTRSRQNPGSATSLYGSRDVVNGADSWDSGSVQATDNRSGVAVDTPAMYKHNGRRSLPAHAFVQSPTQCDPGHSLLSSIRRERVSALIQIACNSPADHTKAVPAASRSSDALGGCSGLKEVPWLLSVEILQARLLPHMSSGPAKRLSCTLAVTKGCSFSLHASMHYGQNVPGRHVQRTQELPASCSPQWMQQFDLSGATQCALCAGREPSSRQRRSGEEVGELVGSNLTIALRIYEHPGDGSRHNQNLVGKLVLPVRPGLEAVDWYMLLSKGGSPLLHESGGIAQMKLRVAYRQADRETTGMGWPHDFVTCVPLQSNQAMVTLVEPGSSGCGVTMIMRQDTTDQQEALTEGFLEDLCNLLSIQRDRISRFTLLSNNSSTTVAFNIYPVDSGLQPTPRDLALTLMQMSCVDQHSALQDTRYLKACRRIVVHCPFSDDELRKEVSKPSLVPFTVSEMWEPIDLAPVSVWAMFQPPKKHIAGIGLALMDTLDKTQVYVHSIIQGGAAHREGTVGIGDIMLAVNDEDVTGMHHGPVRAKVVGDAGTTVRLRLARCADGEVYDLELIRGNLVEFAFANIIDSESIPGSRTPSLLHHAFSEESEDELSFNPATTTQTNCLVLGSPVNSSQVPRVIPTSPVMSSRNVAGHIIKDLSTVLSRSGQGKRSTNATLPMPACLSPSEVAAETIERMYTSDSLDQSIDIAGTDIAPAHSSVGAQVHAPLSQSTQSSSSARACSRRSCVVSSPAGKEASWDSSLPSPSCSGYSTASTPTGRYRVEEALL